jgi:FKBP-type peptidyl-prolyl cis-trans isomerase
MHPRPSPVSTCLWGLLAALWLLTACNKQTPEELLIEQQQEIERYAAENGIMGEFTDKGVYYQILSRTDRLTDLGGFEGIFPPESIDPPTLPEPAPIPPSPGLTDTVVMAYEGRFLDGEVFAIARQDSPLHIRLNQAIEGWRIGLPLLNVGDSAIFIIPSNLAYGSTENGVVPPKSILRYDLKLLGLY